MSLKEKARAFMILLFVVFFIIPVGLGFLSYLMTPDPSVEQSGELLTAAVKPWWLWMVKISPLVFVAFILIASWAGAEDLL
jgi:ABC-type transport system involved in cytochrome c biogenesis permease subunit